MFSFLRSALVAAVLFLFFPFAVLGDDTSVSAIPPELAAADQLYRAGKFAEAEAGYQGVLKNDSKLAPAELCLLKLDWCGLCCDSRKLMKHWTR